MKEEESKLNEQKTLNAIIKRALGYDSKEIVEEYVKGDEGEIVLSKKKVTIKNVPPDVSALKILLDLDKSIDESEMTDEELDEEIERLLLLLKEKNINIKENNKCKKTPKKAKKNCEN